MAKKRSTFTSRQISIRDSLPVKDLSNSPERSGTIWLDAEEELLLELLDDDNWNLSDIAKFFQRTPGSIKARMERINAVGITPISSIIDRRLAALRAHSCFKTKLLILATRLLPKHVIREAGEFLLLESDYMKGE